MISINRILVTEFISVKVPQNLNSVQKYLFSKAVKFLERSRKIYVSDGMSAI